MDPQIVGYREFTDGATRPVYEDERGQLVYDDDERTSVRRLARLR
jgi:hypothetical protein